MTIKVEPRPWVINECTEETLPKKNISRKRIHSIDFKLEKQNNEKKN